LSFLFWRSNCPAPADPPGRSAFSARFGSLNLVADNGAEITGRRQADQPLHRGKFWFAFDGWPIFPPTLLHRTGAPAGRTDRQPLAIFSKLLADVGPSSLPSVGGAFVVLTVWPEIGHVSCFRSLNGSRTCYWARSGHSVAISTRAAAICRLPGFGLEEDPAWMSRFFALDSTVSYGKTPFLDVNELLPGQTLALDESCINLETAAPEADGFEAPESPSDWIRAFAHTFDQAVTETLPASGKTAIMLSGGLDSGPIAAVAAGGPERSAGTLEIISWSLQNFPDADEWAWIDKLARHLKLPAHRIQGNACMPFSDLDSDQADEDFPNYNAFRPLILECYRSASERGHSVILNGATGDNIYPHPRYRLFDALVRADAAEAVQIIFVALKNSMWQKSLELPEFRFIAGELLRRFKNTKPVPPDWLQKHARTHLAEPTGAPDPWLKALGPHRIKRLARDIMMPSISGDLARENRFAARYGLDRRDPFRNPDLLRLMLEIPHSLVYREGTDKWIMREAMRGKLPEDFRTKPRTGILSSFYEAGYRANLPAIKELLNRHDEWQQWVRRNYVHKVLRREFPEPRDALLIGNCIGYTLWQRKLRAQQAMK